MGICLYAAFHLLYSSVIDPRLSAQFCSLKLSVTSFSNARPARRYFAQGWYIVTYALGIYILNLVIGFLTPLVRPFVCYLVMRDITP